MKDTTKYMIRGRISQVNSSIDIFQYYFISIDIDTTHDFISCRTTDFLYEPRVETFGDVLKQTQGRRMP